MQKNRNPQFLIPTKVDKVRSQVIASTVGASRSVAVKANVLNKIVREASGVHNYTIVAPLKTHNEKQKAEILEPETNPRVRPYAQEAKLKPVLVSFGHRPRSASRTFHPATMKFRLKHGEIARGGDNIHKTGFGLPVTVLKQVLKAPKIYRPGEGDFLFGGQYNPEDSFQADSTADNADEVAEPTENYENLFFSEEEHKKMFKPVNQPKNRKTSTSAPTTSHTTSHTPSNTTPFMHAENAQSFLSQYDDNSSTGKASWVSSIEKEAQKKQSPHKPPQMEYPNLEPVNNARHHYALTLCVFIYDTCMACSTRLVGVGLTDNLLKANYSNSLILIFTVGARGRAAGLGRGAPPREAVCESLVPDACLGAHHRQQSFVAG